jgi:DNA-directed RNA polymerase subunit D
MKISVIESTPSSLRFKLSGADSNMANALRRIVINTVQSFAIDKVTFYENSSPMFDEYIAHRIGLVPLVTPTKGYDEKDEIAFSLSAEGPTTVYSKELKSSDKSVKVANEKIPLIKLGEGQTLRLDAKAVMGAGNRSSKFQPGLITFKELSDTDFEFYIETFGQMPPTEILARALSIISDNVKEIHKELKK